MLNDGGVTYSNTGWHKVGCINLKYPNQSVAQKTCILSSAPAEHPWNVQGIPPLLSTLFCRCLDSRDQTRTRPLKTDRWLYEDSAFPVDWSCDVAIILKWTGFGTQERARALLEALLVEISPESVLFVGDFQAE